MVEIEAKPDEQVLATSKTTTPGATYTDAELEQLTVHVFFDGTGNNRFNTATYRENKDKAKEGSVSYENYYSNIALLFMAMQEFDDVKKLYIEGSGTTRDEEDDTAGLGFSKGKSGRTTRVESAFSQLEDILNKINKEKVILNVYGFSRGAAWARHFCYLVKSGKYKDWNVCKINFVGIYDTVSSDGLAHYNDVKESGLDIGIAQEINYIAHITAQNDYRKHFPLTPIHAALHDGIGFECSFPGAHSDIGGGYNERYPEKDRFLGYVEDGEAGVQGKLINTWFGLHMNHKEYIDFNWFIKKGYYRPNQIEYKPTLGQGTKIYATREVEYHYQFITCDAMYEIAKDKANYIRLNDTDFEEGFNEMKKNDYLSRFHEGALAYVKVAYPNKKGGHQVPLLPSEEDMQEIYNRYIHSSLTYDAIDNRGTILSKTKKADGNLDYSNPKRPEVEKGYKYQETPIQNQEGVST